MNRNVRTFNLRSLMNGPDGLGSMAGRRIQPVLIGKVASDGKPQLMCLSLSGVKRIDVNFAREAIIAVIQHHHGRNGVCLTHIVDEDVLENVAAAAERASVPVVVWRGEEPRIVGPQPAASLVSALSAAMAQPRIRAAELAQRLGISLTNASSKLKQLSDGGYLLRDQVTAVSGGNEFVYSRIG